MNKRLTYIERTHPSAEAFKNTCLEYFSDPEINEGVHTLLGLKLYAGLAGDRWHKLYQMEGYREIALWAREVCEFWTEKKLLTDSKSTGAIFQLKSVFGRTELPSTLSESHTYIYVFSNEAKEIKRADRGLLEPIKNFVNLSNPQEVAQALPLQIGQVAVEGAIEEAVERRKEHFRHTREVGRIPAATNPDEVKSPKKRGRPPNPLLQNRREKQARLPAPNPRASQNIYNCKSSGPQSSAKK